MKNLLALTILGLTGCGGLQFEVNSSNVAPEFRAYVQQFVFEGQARGANLNIPALQKLSIQFDDTVTGSTLALCRVELGRLEIHVAPEAWANASKAARELLINHEMGHCILERMAHTDTKKLFNDYYTPSITWQGPESIMNTYAIPASLYVINRDYYLNELFGAYSNAITYYNGPSHFDSSSY